MQVGDLVTVSPFAYTTAIRRPAMGIIVKIKEGDDFGDGPVNSMVSVLASCGIIEVASTYITLR